MKIYYATVDNRSIFQKKENDLKRIDKRKEDQSIETHWVQHKSERGKSVHIDETKGWYIERNHQNPINNGQQMDQSDQASQQTHKGEW